MDRELLIRGIFLIESWEDLNATHLYIWITEYFPVAFKETEKGSFGAYPIGLNCDGSILHIVPKPIDQVIDSEYTFTSGWDAATKKHEVIQELYFSVIAANDYLLKKGFRLNDNRAHSWQTRVRQAERAAAHLNDELVRKNKIEADSEEFKQWINFINTIKTTKSIRLSLVILLDSLTGKSNAELIAGHARTSISRYKSNGRKFIAKNHEMFQHLPRIPLE